MKLKIIALALLGSMALFSCSTETESTEVEMAAQTFVFEDIYEGSNSATVELDVASIKDSESGLEGKEVESAFLSSIVLSKNDSIGLSQITSSKLQIMSEKEDLPMVTVAVITEFAADSKSIELKVIEDVDLEEYLESGKIYLVLDANFNADNEEGQPFEAVMKFKFNTAK